MNRSNSASASARSCPFFIPDHPRLVTVKTSCPVNPRINLRGTHSSSSTLIFLAEECLFHFLKDFDGVLAADRGEVVKELVEAVALFEIIKEGLYRHASPRENR